ncbi:lysin A [Arthrobacter phage Noely]|uniref:Lysin A n=1 Tax=Arthrobacter phage Noely TaxID=2419964 RepID=A0A3G2KAD5_9CAUD|nr:lysin A [Arthrobacter phage Noely]AYN55955.1 lysin A [Arthrobacter phage Noely]
MTTKAQEAFLTSAPGKSFNPDRAHGLQCKDVADAYCLALFGDWVNTIRPGNGKDVFDHASPAYFTKVRNNPADPRQLPPRGAIINYGWSKAVPEGHVAVVLKADAHGVDVIDQDGYAQRPARVSRLGYALPNGAVVVGWLIPKLAADKPSQCVVEPGDTLFGIARQFKVSLQGLIHANPQLKDPNRITPGMVLTLP